MFMNNGSKKLSLIAPAYNEERTIPLFIERFKKVIAQLEHLYNIEIIFIDDGSRDNTLELFREQSLKDKRFKYISFSRNFGHQMAISAGIDAASGDGVIIMDIDLQDPPELLPELITKWEERYEVVYAIRKKRKENIFKRFCFKSFYLLLKRLSYLDMPMDTGIFCLMDRKVVDVLKSLPERNRFIPGLRTWVGFRQTGIEFERSKRAAGKAKKGFFRLVNLALDGIFSFSFLPLRLITIIGFSLALLSFLVGFGAIIFRLVYNIAPPGWASLAVILSFNQGILLLFIGFIGEYIGRIFEEVKQRPKYVIKEASKDLMEKLLH
jgi:glycosyltransferase involved in cell wall biosynthesis